MNKWITVFGFSAVLLGGCNILNEANNTITYASDIKEFLNETQQFTAEVPPLLERASANQGDLQEVKQQLEQMKDEIDQVQAIEAPSVAEGVHERLIGYTEQMESGIDTGLKQIEQGTLNPETWLENSEVWQAARQVQELRANIEKFGQ